MNPTTTASRIGSMGNANTVVDTERADQSNMSRGIRSKAPVFVLGCGRSGTKFLYHTLLSAGGFAVYHAESNAFNLLGLRFGNLAHRRNRRQLLDEYYTSKLFQRTGLEPKDIDERVMQDCRNAGDFLRIVMEAIARRQGADRWAESTPLHLLYLPLIKKLIPDALVIHIIRDGRDVTASLHRIGWIRALPWDRARAFLVPAIFWRWIVSKGRRYGQALGGDYMEVHYEQLVEKPRETLARIGKFVDHDLDYDRIQQVALGSVHNPNSSFRGDGKETEAATVGRWKRMFTLGQVRDIESSIGNLLVETGYEVETPRTELRSSLPVRFMNFLYPLYFDFKLWLKSETPLARIADRGRMGIAESDPRPDATPGAKTKDE
ncbi:MAG: sulfotransferase [Terriglobales bacterium]